MNKMSEKDKQSNWYANKKIRNDLYTKEHYIRKAVRLTLEDYTEINELLGIIGVGKTEFVLDGLNLYLNGTLKEAEEEYNKNPRKKVVKGRDETKPKASNYVCLFKPEVWEEVNNFLTNNNMTLGKLLRITYIYVKGEQK